MTREEARERSRNGVIRWHRREKVRKAHDFRYTPQQIAEKTGERLDQVFVFLKELQACPHQSIGVRLLDYLEASPAWAPTVDLVRVCGRLDWGRQYAFERVHQALRRLVKEGVVQHHTIRIPGRRAVSYWYIQSRRRMSIEDAQSLISNGVPFGDVYEHVTPVDQPLLKEWYCREESVPNLAARNREPVQVGVSIASGYTGSICKNCQGSRMVRTGACERCDDCGDSSSCG